MRSDAVEVEFVGLVAVVKMAHGKVNAMDVEFLAELARIKERSRYDSDVARIWGDPATHELIRKALDRTIGAREGR